MCPPCPIWTTAPGSRGTAIASSTSCPTPLKSPSGTTGSGTTVGVDLAVLVVGDAAGLLTAGGCGVRPLDTETTTPSTTAAAA